MDGKRRLPLWMVGVSTAVKVRKSLDVETNDVVTKEEMSVMTEQMKSMKSKSKGRTTRCRKEACLPSEEVPEAEESSFLVKCETKRRKRGVVEKDVNNCDDGVQEIGVEKRKRGRVGRKIQEHDPSRKKKAKSYEFESCDDIEGALHDEDDEDLTMEDMLSIAKEFVKNASDMGQQKSSEDKCKSKSQFAYTSSSRSETGTSAIVPQDTRSHMHEETTSHHNSIENMTSEVTLADSRITGDAAQDMLDLLLGPLLKKPIGKEQKVSSITEDIILPHEVKKQQQDVIISNKPVTLTKKKSSLRDTVAMLLD